jgi:hypothetical protein
MPAGWSWLVTYGGLRKATVPWYNVGGAVAADWRRQMAIRSVPLEDLKDRSLEDVLREVAGESTFLIVTMPDGREIVIEPRSALKPLPVLEGRVPEGWKDEIYASGR